MLARAVLPGRMQLEPKHRLDACTQHQVSVVIQCDACNCNAFKLITAAEHRGHGVNSVSQLGCNPISLVR